MCWKISTHVDGGLSRGSCVCKPGSEDPHRRERNWDSNQKKIRGPPYPRTMTYLGGQGGYFEKLFEGSETSDMTSEGLGEILEGDSADTCGRKFPLVSMGGRADMLSVHRRGARTPIGANGKLILYSFEAYVLCCAPFPPSPSPFCTHPTMIYFGVNFTFLS